jgi:hypothetical protein
VGVGRGSGADRARLVEQIAFVRIVGRGGGFPFGLGREAGAGPAGEGVGLVIADVADRLGGLDRMETVEAEGEPAPVAALPVERRLDPVGPNPVPAVGQPEGRSRIAALLNEAQPFGIGDRPVGDLVRGNQGAVARPLAIEGEAVGRSADLDDPARPPGAVERGRGRRRFGRRARPDRRLQRILGEGGEHIGQHQFLVLLLVVEAELDQAKRRRRKIGKGSEQGLVDRGAIGPDLVEARAAQHAPARPRMPLALAVVIGVEQIGVAFVEGRIALDVVAKHEGLEEPAGVGEMPFGRRGFGRRLKSGVGVRQRLGEGEAQRPDRPVAVGVVVASRIIGLGGHSSPSRARPF